MKEPAGALRQFLLGLATLEMLGIATDLLFLQHYEDVWQLVPLAVIAAGLGTTLWHLVSASEASIRLLQFVMALAIVSGLVGFGLHFNANAEFQTDIDPSLSGAALWLKVLRAKAPPALAPGVMAHLGLVGLAYTYRHPRLSVSG